jgi:hypothetical protein
MTVKVNSSSDMSRVCLKSKWATIEIPELEFEISADGKRRTDSIHNHIAAAFYNLSKFVSAFLVRALGTSWDRGVRRRALGSRACLVALCVASRRESTPPPPGYTLVKN